MTDNQSSEITAREIAAAAAAYLGLVLVDGALRAIGFRRTVSMLDRFVRCPQDLGSMYDRERFTTVCTAVGRAAQRYRWRNACLRQAVLLRVWLRLSGCEAAIRLGARRTATGSLSGHAWLEIEGVPVAEPNDSQDRYVLFV